MGKKAEEGWAAAGQEFIRVVERQAGNRVGSRVGKTGDVHIFLGVLQDPDLEAGPAGGCGTSKASIHNQETGIAINSTTAILVSQGWEASIGTRTLHLVGQDMC